MGVIEKEANEPVQRPRGWRDRGWLSELEGQCGWRAESKQVTWRRGESRGGEWGGDRDFRLGQT